MTPPGAPYLSVVLKDDQVRLVAKETRDTQGERWCKQHSDDDNNERKCLYERVRELS